MSTIQAVHLQELLNLRFRSVFVAFMNLGPEDLLRAACSYISDAFGVPTDQMNRDKGSQDFVLNYVGEVLMPYVLSTAVFQIALLDPTGTLDTRSVAETFSKQLDIVKEKILPHQEAANAILSEEPRRNSFFVAIVGICALCCLEKKEFADLYRLKKTLFGRWKEA